jgi:hypothetical protein
MTALGEVEITMPTEYRQRPANRHTQHDWVSLIGILGALLILVVSSIGYIANKMDSPRQAAVKAYLESGISPPRP